MKAARWYERGDIRIEEVPDPEPGAGEVLLKIKVCGLCGSDMHEYRDGPFIIPAKPHPLTGRSGGPVTLGHEFSAEVEATGDGAVNFQKGDRVTVNALLYCGKCHYCGKGQYNMCVKLGTVGFAADGAFAEYAVLPEYTLFRLPDSVDDDMGAFVEPVAVAIRAVKQARVRIGHDVVVIGAGPIGLLVMQACRNAGASRIFVVEPMEARRILAAQLGADEVIDPNEAAPDKVISGLTGRLKADRAIDCVGTQASFDTAVKASGRRAVICVAGLSLKPIEVPFSRMWGQEKELTFSTGYEDEFPAAIAYLANGSIKVNELITARIKLENFMNDGIKEQMEHAGEHIKMLVYP